MRTRIVDAAEKMLIEQGARAATTRALARAAGCAEGTLYVHFPDRVAIFAAVFEKRWPVAMHALAALQEQVGHGDVADNIADALSAIRSFMLALEPLVAAVKSDPALGPAMQQRWRELNGGPHHIVQGLQSYIGLEQAAGRSDAAIDAETAAEALVGFLFYTMASGHFRPGGARDLSREQLRSLILLNVRPHG